MSFRVPSSLALVVALLSLLLLQLAEIHQAHAALLRRPQVSLSVLGIDLRLQLIEDSDNSINSNIPGSSYVEAVFVSSIDSLYSSAYMSHGMAPIAMSGALVVCKFPTAASTATPCVNLDGDGYDVSVRPTTLTRVISSNVSAAGVATVVVQTPTANVYNCRASGGGGGGGPLRWIFARGEWKEPKSSSSRPSPSSSAGDSSSSLGRPGGHGSSWAQATIDLCQGTVVMLDNSNDIYLVLFVAWLVAVLLALAGAALKSFRRHRPATRSVAYFCTWIVLLSCLVAVIVVSNSVHHEQGNFAPTARAFGEGCVFIFSVLLFPTTKYLNLGELVAGASYDRQISFHDWGGTLLMFVAGIHGIWMLVASGNLGFVEICFVARDGVPNTFLAFFGFILMVPFTLLGVLRGSSLVPYHWFRISHAVFPVFLVMFMVHYPPLAVACAPGLLIYISDLVLRAVRSKGICVKSSEVDLDAKVVKLVVSVPQAQMQRFANAHAGSFVIFGLASCSIVPHPFTIASRTVDGAELTFFIKVGTESGRKCDERSFTQLLFDEASKNALAGQPFHTFVGPVGTPEVDLSVASNVVFVSGGSGVTVALGLMQTYAERLQQQQSNTNNNNNSKSNTALNNGKKSSNNTDAMIEPMDCELTPASSNYEEELCGAASQKRGGNKNNNNNNNNNDAQLRSVTFVWSVREPSFVRMALPYIVECAKVFTSSSSSVAFVARIFVTGRGAAATEPLSSSLGSSYDQHCIEFSIGRRPDAHDLQPVLSDGRLCYFSCGPASLMELVNQVACEKGALQHAEEYSF